MRKLSLRRRPVQIAVGALVTVALALTVAFGGVSRMAEASGMHGGIVIYPDGSLSAFDPGVITTQQPANTCTTDGASGARTCTFTADPHTGGAIVQKGVTECFLMLPSGGYFTSFNSFVEYSPSGQVMIRCTK
jgi:hypothetical protein